MRKQAEIQINHSKRLTRGFNHRHRAAEAQWAITSRDSKTKLLLSLLVIDFKKNLDDYATGTCFEIFYLGNWITTTRRAVGICFYGEVSPYIKDWKNRRKGKRNEANKEASKEGSKAARREGEKEGRHSSSISTRRSPTGSHPSLPHRECLF